MKKFNLEGKVCGMVTTTVFAETLEQAIAIAKIRDVEQMVYNNDEQDHGAWVLDFNVTEVLDVENK